MNIKNSTFGKEFIELSEKGVGKLAALKGALEKVTDVEGGFIKQIAALARMHPIITGIAVAFAAIGGAAVLIDAVTESLSEAQEKAAASKSDYESVTSEIESMNSELETTSCLSSDA